METPLFRARSKAETIFCYSEAERDAASAKLGGKPEILSKVEYAPRAESGPVFNFYMGKNTPARKDYIMDKLVVPVEE
jgi:topoisomerase IV subunit B